jgi:hypothetical protein
MPGSKKINEASMGLKIGPPFPILMLYSNYILHPQFLKLTGEQSL